MQTICSAVYDDIVKKYGKPDKVRITAPADVLQIKQVAYLSKKNQEEFIVISLNAASEVIKSRTVTTGLVNHSLVHPREVYRNAILDNAVSVICIHNHPSGNLEASAQDIHITKQLKEAGDIIGISVLDHIIVSKLGITSLRECGYL